MFNLFKKKPAAPKPEEIRNPELVQKIKSKIDTLSKKSKIVAKQDNSLHTKSTYLTLGKICFFAWELWDVYEGTSYKFGGGLSGIDLCRSDTKELFFYLQDKYQEQYKKRRDKSAKESIKYLNQ